MQKRRRLHRRQINRLPYLLAACISSLVLRDLDVPRKTHSRDSSERISVHPRGQRQFERFSFEFPSIAFLLRLLLLVRLFRRVARSAATSPDISSISLAVPRPGPYGIRTSSDAQTLLTRWPGSSRRLIYRTRTLPSRHGPSDDREVRHLDRSGKQ